jgi:Zn-dependent protease with chaperone function
MNNDLSKVLEEISFLYHSFPAFSQSDDVSEMLSSNYSQLENLIRKWEPKVLICFDSNYLSNGLTRCESSIEKESLKEKIDESIDFLTLSLTKKNLNTLYHDIKECGEVFALPEEFYNFLENEVVPKWNIDLEQNDSEPSLDYSLRQAHFCQTFRIKREAALTAILREAFQIHSLVPLFRKLEGESSSLVMRENIWRGHSLDANLTPRIDRLLKKALSKLELKEPFSFFVQNQPEHGAWIFSGSTSFGINCITLTSELIKDLPDEELLFVIGHEIGHWFFSNSEIRNLLSISYNDDEHNPSLNLQNLLATWFKLSELSADRVGLLTCGSLDAAVNALYRVSTGLDPAEMEFSIDSYLKDEMNAGSVNEQMSVFREDMHPPLVIRLKALKLFGESLSFQRWSKDHVLLEKDETLSQGMSQVVSLIDFCSEDPMHNKRLLIIALGGFLMADVDDEITIEEVERVRDYVLRFTLNPDPVILYVKKLFEDGGNLWKLLSDNLKDLLYEDEDEKYGIIEYFIDIALIDGDLRKKETDILLQLGEFMNMSSASVLQLIAQQLGKDVFFEKRIPEEVGKMLNHESPFLHANRESRLKSAGDEHTDSSMLKKLSDDADIEVRLKVLFNESTPDDVRMSLLDSPSILQELNNMENEGK